eukprot:CAMPEP_0115582510 /NCGR_PEP_ID=MMETSP0272-20121206/5698_1 /TAXON_ID=71861 /ORGANISM="Scrippsiella trochoidea, Strain CCMP3099" /LENGTH=828 /DNA_ID=CAMNT_0003017501 /DNA_START=48 /DNA_END=2530 /DNA_ORIENTATION=+
MSLLGRPCPIQGDASCEFDQVTLFQHSHTLTKRALEVQHATEGHNGTAGVTGLGVTRANVSDGHNGTAGVAGLGVTSANFSAAGTEEAASSGPAFLDVPFFVALGMVALTIYVCVRVVLGSKTPVVRKASTWSPLILAFVVAYASGARTFLKVPKSVGGVVGLTVWEWSGPFAVILALAVMYDVLGSGRWSSEQQLGYLVAMVVISFGVGTFGLYCMQEILRCGVYWCTADMEVVKSGEWLHLGFLLASVGLGMGLSFLAVLARLPKRATQVGYLAVLILPLLFFLAGTLPNSYHYTSAAYIGSGLTTPFIRYETAEWSYAWMSSWTMEISSSFLIKMLPDVIMYYIFLEVLAITAVAAAVVPSFAVWLSKPGLRVTRLSRGETIVVSMFVVLFNLFGFYWLHDHAFLSGAKVASFSATERLGRTWGLAVLCMGLCFLPASKNSLWLKALGVSWERGVWAHRWLGVLSLVCMVCHILTYWVRFVEVGSFPYDAFAFLQYWSASSGVDTSVNNNYTIGMMQLVAYPAILMISISAWFRHGKGNNWEYFKYMHFVFLVLVPATLLHAASSWYYLLGGIAFYLIDASIRFVGVVSPQARVLKLSVKEVDTGYSLLTFDRSHTEAGQFAWIRVPMISDWEWHPFSICSAPSDGQIKMCIKNMGPGTWTDSLFQLACEFEGVEDPWPVQLDGPYGPPLAPFLEGHAGALLVAGGITQPHSVFRELAAYYKENKSLPGGLKFLKLIWVARSSKTFEVFSTSIRECLAGVPESVMSCEYFLSKPGSSSGRSVPVTEGRPIWGEVYASAGRALAEDETLLVQACGPESMVDEAAAV